MTTSRAFSRPADAHSEDVRARRRRLSDARPSRARVRKRRSPMNLDRPAWRRRPARTALRVATSLIRRSIPGLRGPAVKYDEGRSRIVADLSTPLGLELYRYGERVDPDLDLLRCLLRPGDVCVDGGANVGLFTLVAAAKVGPTGKVVAFEPAPKTHVALRANVELNGFSWVERREEALDDCAGERDLISFEAAVSGLSSFRPRTHPREVVPSAFERSLWTKRCTRTTWPVCESSNSISRAPSSARSMADAPYSRAQSRI